MTKIAVVLPTYNEKENIQKIIPQILSQNKDISIIRDKRKREKQASPLTLFLTFQELSIFK